MCLDHTIECHFGINIALLMFILFGKMLFSIGTHLNPTNNIYFQHSTEIFSWSRCKLNMMRLDTTCMHPLLPFFTSRSFTIICYFLYYCWSATVVYYHQHPLAAVLLRRILQLLLHCLNVNLS